MESSPSGTSPCIMAGQNGIGFDVGFKSFCPKLTQNSFTLHYQRKCEAPDNCERAGKFIFAPCTHEKNKLSGKESACRCRRPAFDLWVGKIPWRKN